MVSNTLIEKKMKGSASQYKSGAFEFTPYGEGTAVYASRSRGEMLRYRRKQGDSAKSDATLGGVASTLEAMVDSLENAENRP